MSAPPPLLSLSERLGFAAGGLSIAAGIVYLLCFALIGPTLERRRSELERFGWLVHLVQDAEATERRYTDVLARQAELQKRVQAILTRLPEQPDVDGLLTEISELARQSGAELTTFQPFEAQRDAETPFQRIRCQFDTDWSGICHVLEGLRRIHALVNIDEVRLAADAQGRLAPTLVDLKLLFAPPQSAEPTEPGRQRNAREGVET